jgi:hypothetical protein
MRACDGRRFRLARPAASMLKPELDSEHVLQSRLDVAITRNAHLIVALRHAIATAHIVGEGHERSVRWPLCSHKECRTAATLIGEAR